MVRHGSAQGSAVFSCHVIDAPLSLNYTQNPHFKVQQTCGISGEKELLATQQICILLRILEFVLVKL